MATAPEGAAPREIKNRLDAGQDSKPPRCPQLKSNAARQRLVRFAAKRSARRQRQAYHLQQCGARAVLEALLSVESGEPLEAVLSDFCRLPPATYHAVVMLYCDEVAG